MKNCPGSWNGVAAVEEVEEHVNEAGRAYKADRKAFAARFAQL
jgi:hypothetical protein